MHLPFLDLFGLFRFFSPKPLMSNLTQCKLQSIAKRDFNPYWLQLQCKCKWACIPRVSAATEKGMSHRVSSVFLSHHPPPSHKKIQYHHVLSCLCRRHKDGECIKGSGHYNGSGTSAVRKNTWSSSVHITKFRVDSLFPRSSWGQDGCGRR